VYEYREAGRASVLVQYLLDLAEGLGALIRVGGVDVEKARFSSLLLYLFLYLFDLGHCGFSVEVHAEYVHAVRGELKRRGLAETARCPEYQSPTVFQTVSHAG
jgi:hypothetical protein